MKKFLAILMAAALCATVAYSACAEDASDAETTVDSSLTVDDVASQLLNDEKATELADQISAAIESGATQADVSDLIGALTDYVNKAGFDLADLQDGGAVRDVLDKFLEDAGVNSDELNEAISGSVVANSALDLYYSPEEPTTPAEKEDEPTDDDVVIPDTDFVG